MSALDEYNARRALDGKRTKQRKQRDAIPQAVLEAKIIGKPCRVCAATVGRGDTDRMWAVEAHHLVPRGILRGSDLHAEDNLIPLCHPHHQDHHNTGHSRVPRALLTPAEVVFITHQQTSGWCDLWYPTTDVDE